MTKLFKGDVLRTPSFSCICLIVFSSNFYFIGKKIFVSCSGVLVFLPKCKPLLKWCHLSVREHKLNRPSMCCSVVSE